MKFLFPLLFLAGFAYGQPVCFPEFNDNDHHITHFEFNSIFNIHSNHSGDNDVYSQGVFTTTVSLGETYSLQVASDEAALFNNRFSAWIDYNNDGVFTPEEVILETNEFDLEYKNKRVTIPIDSSYLGVRRLRVMMAESSSISLEPCGQYFSGESEDYFITITDTYEEPCYCIPFVDGSGSFAIEDFHIEGILNCDSGYDEQSSYTYYDDSEFTTDLELGKTYRILVSKGTNAGNSVGFRVNIDFDDNHIFESDESVLHTPVGNGIIDKYITIPNSISILGQHRLRARIARHETPPSDCTWVNGETEDYIINIVPQDTNQIINSEWQKIINLPKDQNTFDIIETYDSGYIVSLTEETAPSKVRLIKFSIDGDILWSKFPPSSGESEYPVKMQETNDGGFIVCGLTFMNEIWGDPSVTKFNACGDQEWKQTYGNLDNYDTASHLIQSSDSNTVVLFKYLNDTSRIALAKLDTLGNVIWQNDYTHHLGSEPRDLIETSDMGFLITGYTYTPNPGDSSTNSLRSMIIKIDSNGNEEWEKVLGVTDTSLSYAFSSVELETGGFLVSASSVDRQTNDRKMGVYRVDATGNLIFFKQLSEEPSSFGTFIRKMEGDNYCIVSKIYNDCFRFTSALGLHMIDSAANVLDSTFIKDYYLDIEGAIVTDNNKLVVTGKKVFPDDDEIFMFKFNEDLEFDTLYNTDLDYNWLCDIIISQDNLPEENFEIDLFPNPAREGINIQIHESNQLNYIVDVLSLNGSILKSKPIRSNELKYFSLEGLSPGMYIVTFSNKNSVLSSRKIILQK